MEGRIEQVGTLVGHLNNPTIIVKGLPGENGLPGKDGKDGRDGRDGKDGHAPVKGKDYWNEEDKAEIKALIEEVYDEKIIVLMEAEY